MVTISRWDVIERLDSEERIAGFLEAVIEEGGASSLPRALAKAAKARAINQLAKTTGIDRKTLCKMFSEDCNIEVEPDLSTDLVVKVSKAFAVPVPV
jgi:probable addiction module antidote protein